MLSALCSSALASKPKSKKPTLCLNQSWTSIDLCFLVLHSGLDATAEEQCADSIEEIYMYTYRKVFSRFWQLLPGMSKTQWKKNKPMEVHESATPHGYHPGVHDLLIFSCFGRLPRKLLETMGGNTTQPRLEHIISKHVSAWPLNICFQILQYIPCAAIFCSGNILFLA